MKLTKYHSVWLRDSAEFNPKEYKIIKGGLMTNGKCIPSSISVIWGKLKEAKEGARHMAQALYFPMSKYTVSSVKAFLKRNRIDYVFFETGPKNKVAEVVAVAKYLEIYPKEISPLTPMEAFFSLRAGLEKAVSYRFGPDAWASDFSSTEVIIGYSKSDIHSMSSYESGEYEKINYKVVKGEVKLAGAVTKVTKAVSYVSEMTDKDWGRLWKIEAGLIEMIEKVARICRAFKT